MSHDAHLAAVEQAINELSNLGAGLGTSLQQASEAFAAVRNAVGESGNDDAGTARQLASELADDQNGTIVGCMTQVAGAIEALSAYRAAWANPQR